MPLGSWLRSSGRLWTRSGPLCWSPLMRHPSTSSVFQWQKSEPTWWLISAESLSDGETTCASTEPPTGTWSRNAPELAGRSSYQSPPPLSGTSSPSAPPCLNSPVSWSCGGPAWASGGFCAGVAALARVSFFSSTPRQPFARCQREDRGLPLSGACWDPLEQWLWGRVASSGVCTSLLRTIPRTHLHGDSGRDLPPRGETNRAISYGCNSDSTSSANDFNARLASGALHSAPLPPVLPPPLSFLSLFGLVRDVFATCPSLLSSLLSFSANCLCHVPSHARACHSPIALRIAVSRLRPCTCMLYLHLIDVHAFYICDHCR